jgi:hypothetical protein
MDIKGWATDHNSRVVERAPRRAPITLRIGAAIWVALAALLVAVAVGDGGLGGLRGFALPVALCIGIAAWLLWRATRFRMAAEAEQVGGALVLIAPRWNVTLQRGDVKQVVQLRRNPYAYGIYNVENAAWGAWFRIDASTGGAGVRRYLVWRADSPAFLEQLRGAGFPVAGGVAPLQ